MRWRDRNVLKAFEVVDTRKIREAKSATKGDLARAYYLEKRSHDSVIGFYKECGEDESRALQAI